MNATPEQAANLKLAAFLRRRIQNPLVTARASDYDIMDNLISLLKETESELSSSWKKENNP